MAEKVTLMRLKVDLQCSKCYKKVKKVLCKFPQVRDQVFDEKQNMVNITVVCCSPEKIRDKLCCKGGGAIKSIEIVEPPKKADDKKDGDKPKSDGDKPKGGGDGDKKKDADKPKGGGDGDKKKDSDKPKGGGDGDKKKDADKPKADAPKKDGGGDKAKDKAADKPADKPKDKPADSKAKNPDPIPVPIQPPAVPPPVAVPAAMVVTPFYEGYPSGPYYQGYGQPAVVYDGYYGRPVYDSYGGGGRPIYVSRCDQYFNEENPQGCSIM